MIAASIKRKLFLQKGEYQTCHICLNGTQEHTAAITVNQQFYSFFKTVRDRDKALDILGKLYDSGSDAIITQAPKAYAIWVLEEDALLVERKPKTSVTDRQLVAATA
jgi:hypothetical protein